MSPVWWESDDGWVNPAHVAAVDVLDNHGGGFVVVATLAAGGTRLLAWALADREAATRRAGELIRAHLEATS